MLVSIVGHGTNVLIRNKAPYLLPFSVLGLGAARGEAEGGAHRQITDNR